MSKIYSSELTKRVEDVLGDLVERIGKHESKKSDNSFDQEYQTLNHRIKLLHNCLEGHVDFVGMRGLVNQIVNMVNMALESVESEYLIAVVPGDTEYNFSIVAVDASDIVTTEEYEDGQ